MISFDMKKNWNVKKIMRKMKNKVDLEVPGVSPQTSQP